MLLITGVGLVTEDGTTPDPERKLGNMMTSSMLMVVKCEVCGATATNPFSREAA